MQATPWPGRRTTCPCPPADAGTVADYERLPDDGQRYELINGDLRLALAPTPDHQAASLRLAHYLFTCVESAGHGRVFTAPIDVELGPTTVVQPDLIVILPGGAASITVQRIVGPPDLVVEVVSPGTASYDRRAKRDLYAAAGVREYWIADPGHRVVELLTLAGTFYRAEHVCRGQAVIPSAIIPGWNVATERLFG